MGLAVDAHHETGAHGGQPARAATGAQSDQPQGTGGYDFDEVRRRWTSLASPLTSAAGARRPRPSKEKRFKASALGRGTLENRFRRILVRWDKSPDNYIDFACALTALGLLGSGSPPAWTFNS